MNLILRTLVGVSFSAMAALSAAPAVAAGAVAISPDRSVIFWSVHKPTIGIAVDYAMSHCAAQFGSCRVDRTFGSGCLGVARSGNHRIWGFAIRNSPDEARLAGIGSCAQDGAACTIQTVSCE